MEAAELTEFQLRLLEVAEAGLATVVLACSLMVFLLAVLTVRHF